MLKLSPRILFLFSSFVALTNQSIVSGAALKCKYDSTSTPHGVEGSVYYCNVENDEIFNVGHVKFDSVEGNHTARNTNVNVNGIKFYEIPSMKFFPQNIENIFDNLVFISVYDTNLQEIKQENLKPYKKLRSLNLVRNKITTIDENLFEFNPELRAIGLNENEIFNINPNVFDNLSYLNRLSLSRNKCKHDLSYADKRLEVLQRIQQIKTGDCTTAVVMQKRKEIQEQEFKQKIIKITDAVWSSKYSAIERNLTHGNDEKSTILKEVNELREAERINAEKIKNLEESNAELNNSLSEIRDQNEKLQSEVEQSKNFTEKLQNTVDELKTIIKDLREKYEENNELQSSNNKTNELRSKYENVLQSKLALSESLNELSDKYINLLNTKLIDGEKFVETKKNHKSENNEADDEQEKSIVGGGLTLHFENSKPSIIVVN